MINAYALDPERRLLPITESEIQGHFEAPASTLWVDVEGADVEARKDWLDRLGVDGLTRRILLEADDRSGLYPLQAQILVVTPLLIGDLAAPLVKHLGIVCRDDLLITLHDAPLASHERLSDIEHSQTWLAERSAPALLAAVLVDASTDHLRAVELLRAAVVALENRVEADPADVSADEIIDLRKRLLTIVAAVSDALPIANALAAAEDGSISIGPTRDFLRCSAVNLQAADGQLGWLDGRLADLRSRFELHAQEQTNRRLNMLTILSAIFMPVTLMASIWGMNFAAMPELALPYAYPAGLIAMAAVALGMYLFFRRNGWFD
jgi:magnesium transporter